MAGGKIQKTRHQHLQREIPFQKSNGPHNLRDPMLVDSIVQRAGIKPSDVVLEVGLGIGNLTKKLLEVAKSVVVIEPDPFMALQLNDRFQGTPHAARLKVMLSTFKGAITIYRAFLSQGSGHLFLASYFVDDLSLSDQAAKKLPLNK